MPERIGKGGMEVVYGPATPNSFERQARAAALLQHANVVTIYEPFHPHRDAHIRRLP